MSGIISKEHNFPFTKLRFKTFLFLNIPNILLQLKTWKPSFPCISIITLNFSRAPKGPDMHGVKNRWPPTPTTQRPKELAVLACSNQRLPHPSVFSRNLEVLSSPWLPGSISAPAEQRRFGQLGWVTPGGCALRLGLDSLPRNPAARGSPSRYRTSKEQLPRQKANPPCC